MRAGMVFTIEPALRIPEEKIYIRLEDLIIITDNGKEITSDFLPMDVCPIEDVMKDQGMLQPYPRAQWQGIGGNLKMQFSWRGTQNPVKGIVFTVNALFVAVLSIGSTARLSKLN